MTKEPKSAPASAATDTRAKIVDALMALAAERRFEEIAIRDISAAAKVSLADFRDAFPSKGAVLAGFVRRIDRAALSADGEEISREAPRERLFDALMRRLDAMAPYREALREITAWLRRDPFAALAMNASAVNSMRFMLEAAGIDNQGMAGAIKLQGLALAWARVVAVWLDDPEPELSKTMAELDRELTRGGHAVAAVDRLERLAAPFKAIALAACEQRKRAREAFRRRPRQTDEPRDAGAF
ncbi:MAG: TetR/AcrR family transcriptional regulator [Roseiarcus sp.]|jgi:AcrR family transcriptional regulator